MLANARRPSGRQGEMGPVLLSERARKLALAALEAIRSAAARESSVARNLL